jgi:hypothetical protein
MQQLRVLSCQLEFVHVLSLLSLKEKSFITLNSEFSTGRDEFDRPGSAGKRRPEFWTLFRKLRSRFFLRRFPFFVVQRQNKASAPLLYNWFLPVLR